MSIKSNIKTVIVFPLRTEAEISGEKSSVEFFKKLLSGSEFKMGNGNNRVSFQWTWLENIRRLLDLYHCPVPKDGGVLIVKIPTPSQLPLAYYLTRKAGGRVIFWIDGLNWELNSWCMTFSLLISEPALIFFRMIFNNSIWVGLVRKKHLELIVSSKVQKDKLNQLDLPLSRIHIVPNGTSMLSDCKFNVENLAEKQEANKGLRIGYIGHSYKTKGVEDLLSALYKLKKERLLFSAHFAFSTLGHKNIQNRAKNDGYIISGKVNKEYFYRNIDLLVFPYWADWGTNVYPNVLLESLEFGVPVITTDLPIMRELFGCNGMAIFVPPRNSNVLAETLLQIMYGEMKLPESNDLKEYFKSRYSQDLSKNIWLSILSGE